MRRLTILTLSLSKEYLRNRQAVFFALLFPIILLVIFSAVFAGGSAEFTVYVQNNDLADGEPTELSDAYVESLTETGSLDVKRLDPDRNLTAWSERGQSTEAQRVVVIPDGFEQRIRRQSVRVRMAVIADTLDRFGDRLSADQRSELESNLSQARSQLGDGEGPVTIQLRTSPDDEAADAVFGILQSHVGTFNDRAIGVEEPTATIETEERDDSGLSAVGYYLPAFIAAIVMFNGVVSVTQYVSEFSQRGTLKRLVATPLRKRDWILAVMIQQSLLAVVLTLVMVLVAAVLYGVTVIPGPLALALVVVGAVAFSAIGIMLGSVIRDSNAAVSLGLAVALPLMFLSGVFWEVELMPATVQQVTAFMPLLYFHQGLRQLMIVETTDGVWLSFAILGTMAVTFLVLAVRTVRWKDFG
jgi:ABC-2 type transport system permease protein